MIEILQDSKAELKLCRFNQHFYAQQALSVLASGGKGV
jgi:hypothetical protein